MKIGVISDTHLRAPGSEFKKVIELHFKEVEKILHAGDFIDRSIADYLSSQKELIAVCGNMDPEAIREAFPRKTVVHLNGFTIGLIHGGGPPLGIEQRIRDEFDQVDAIVYGHTHTPAHHQRKEVFFFNPGSPTHPAEKGGTIGILRIGERIEGEIISI